MSLLTILIWAAWPLLTAAQSTNATCSSSYDWAKNSRGQSPCAVASYLQGTCVNGDFNIRALPPGTHYSGPTVAGANSCYCSTVVYSLISACADCQGRPFISWSSWAANCSSPSLSKFGNDIPALTVVPSWAYLNVVTADTYNPVLAQSEAKLQHPESTRTAAGSSNTSPPRGSDGTKNIGAIAGGVVGGVVGIGLLAGLVVWYILRRRRMQSAPSRQYMSEDHHEVEQKEGYGSEPSTAGSPFSPYDPNNPSTFPPSPAHFTDYTDYGYQHNPTNQLYSNRYTGVPEI